jgi:long-chain acyl-CoA synthetase
MDAQGMKSPESLIQRWAQTLARKGQDGALFDRNGPSLRTFRQIDDDALGFASALEGFGDGEVIAIQIGNRPDWPALLLASWRQGLVVLPLETTISERERDVALEVCRANGLVTAKATGTNDIEIRPLRAMVPISWHGSPPVLLKLTSGTTAAPRAIRFRSEQLLADCDNICETMGITDADKNFGVIPVSHSYGFSNLLTPLIARGVPLVLSRDRLPRAVVEDLAASGATVFPGMPVFYQAFCEMPDVPPLPSLRLCVSAGAPLPGALAQKFQNRFRQPIHSFYGSSECGGICYDSAGTNSIDGFVGTPMQGVDLECVEPAEEMSQVRVRSDAVGDGYFPEPDPDKLGNGVFVPDDLLARDAQGFRIAGRISDLINVAGKKVNPAEVEAQLLAFPGVRQAVVFGMKSSRRNEEVAACIVTNSGITEAEVLSFCRTRLSGWQVPKRLFIVDEIPVNERGKTSRRELALKFAAE